MIYIFNDLEWKDINNFKNVVDDTYQISKYGDVRYKNDNKKITIKIANKNKHPYYAAYLKLKNEKSGWILIHQLVGRFFLTPDKKYKDVDLDSLVVDHLNNNGLNNYYLNLQLKTRGENVSDAFKMGFNDLSGEKHRDSFISDEEAYKICECIEKNMCIEDILKKMNMPINKKYRTLIARIHHKSSFKKISKNFNFPKKLYTKQQQYIISLIPKIIEMEKSGKSDYEIYKILWGNNENYKYNSRMLTLKNIRERKIYKDVINNYIFDCSTTIEIEIRE